MHPIDDQQFPSQLLDLLRKFFPVRASAVILVLKRENSQHHRVEDWRESQLIKFASTLSVMAAELGRAYEEQQIHTLAWTTRNLLEVSIWIGFCNSSPERAKRFRDDAVQDAHGVIKAVQRMSAAKGSPQYIRLNDTQLRLSEFARTWGVNGVGDEYKRVSEAANELGQVNSSAETRRVLKYWGVSRLD